MKKKNNKKNTDGFPQTRGLCYDSCITFLRVWCVGEVVVAIVKSLSWFSRYDRPMVKAHLLHKIEHCLKIKLIYPHDLS